MFVVILRYTQPLEEIDRLMRSHVRFLEEGFRAGVFIASGRRVPRTGGVILAVASSREELEARLERDPFITEGAATIEIVEFRSSFHHPALAAFADRGTRAIRDVPGVARE